MKHAHMRQDAKDAEALEHVLASAVRKAEVGSVELQT